MKKINLPKLKIPARALSALLIVAILTASGAAYALVKKSKKKDEMIPEEMVWNENFHHSFFSDDIFSEMEEMEKQMNKAFEDHRKMMKRMFRNAQNHQKSSDSSSAFLSLHQDEKSYRYSLKFNSFKKEDVVVSVSDGVLTISARAEKISENKKEKQIDSSRNFYYSLSIPSDAKGDPEVIREDGEITITFTKSDK